MKSFKELFGAMVSAELLEIFDGAEVLDCQVDQDMRLLSLTILAQDKIDDVFIGDFMDACKKALKLYDIVVELKYKNEEKEQEVEIASQEINVSLDSIKAIIEKIKFSLRIVGGFLEGAEYILKGDNLEIVLMHGGLTTIESKSSRNNASAG